VWARPPPVPAPSQLPVAPFPPSTWWQRWLFVWGRCYREKDTHQFLRAQLADDLELSPVAHRTHPVGRGALRYVRLDLDLMAGDYARLPRGRVVLCFLV
jgi:hypothetical protein